MERDDQDRNEPATPHKLDEARERGQVARSAEFTGALVVVGFLVVAAATTAGIGSALARASERMMLAAGTVDPTAAAFAPWLWRAIEPVLLALSPVLLTVTVIALVGNLAQVGPVFSATPITPDLSRLNPASGLKRLFTRRTLFEAAKVMGKLGALGLVGWFGAASLFAALLELPRLPLSDALHAGQGIAIDASIAVLAVLLAAAVLDLWFNRRDFARQMRMSRRDLQDEHKRREGNPEVRARRRRLQQELAKRSRALTRVPAADVVITNPTHVAVALQYRPSSMRAPVVLAKGAGPLAAHIRALAVRAGIPIVQRPPLARRLLREVPIDGPIPDSAFAAVAPLYRELMARPGHRIR